ncbi:MAG: hypothetical protein H8D67_08420 [Deltaproteobacteria bacterium]|nr:hypothetical protein [Deltaproteobacteria bacterium]
MEMEVELTEAGKTWLQEHPPQGIVWEYDPDKTFKLHIVATDFVEPTYLGIPYRIPNTADGKPTIKKAAQ